MSCFFAWNFIIDVMFFASAEQRRDKKAIRDAREATLVDALEHTPKHFTPRHKPLTLTATLEIAEQRRDTKVVRDAREAALVDADVLGPGGC